MATAFQARLLVDPARRNEATPDRRCGHMPGLPPNGGPLGRYHPETEIQANHEGGSAVTAQKKADEAPVRTSTAATAVTTSTSQRKPWIKKTPVEVVLSQINRLRDDVAAKEEELKKTRRKLEKLERK